MTPLQIDRAVNAALSRILPPMVRALRDDLVAALREEKLLAAVTGGDVVVPAAPIEAVQPKVPPAPRRAAGPKTARDVGRAARGRGGKLPEADVIRARAAYFETGGSLATAAARTGLAKTTISSLAGRLGWREELRQPPEPSAEARPAERAQLPPEIPEAARASQTVVVVPAAVVPAPRRPPVTLAVPPPPRPKPTPQVITTTPKEVRAWLIASLKAGGMTRVQAEDRVAFMTHDQALAEANQRRLRAGHPPFAFIGGRSAA